MVKPLEAATNAILLRWEYASRSYAEDVVRFAVTAFLNAAMKDRDLCVEIGRQAQNRTYAVAGQVAICALIDSLDAE